MRNRLAVLLFLLAPVAARAQERGLPTLPPDIEDRVRELRTDAAALHLTGPVSIPADSVLTGDLVVEDGTLDHAGHVTGDVLVVSGDLRLAPGARVDGDVLVVGGSITGMENATIGGTLISYDGDVRDDERHDDEWEDEDDWEDDEADRDRDEDDRDRRRRRRDRDEGGIDLGLSIGTNYNRIEGLPVMFGPVIETAGPNRLHIAAQAIWRTEPSESIDEEIGYSIRVDQALFGGRVRIGGDARSMVRPVETRGLNATEASLAALLFHSDLHDYYHDESWAARLELRPHPTVQAGLAYRNAEHVPLESSDPWSLFRGGDDWRAQPVVAVGDVSTLELDLNFDTRDDDEEPVRGFLVSIGAEHALDHELVMPGIDLDGTVGGGLGFDDFTSAHIDVRTYVPLNRSSTINLRGLIAGTIEEAVLPPQFQHALGGIGTLPGFSLFSGSCGSRDPRIRLVTGDTSGVNILSDEPMLPAYGCDRIALAQLEYRGGFAFRDDDWDDQDEDDENREHDEDEDDGIWWEVDEHLSPDWAFFVDVGRGWAYGDMTFTERADTETIADVGLGVLFDQAGVYAALPLTGDDRSLRVFVRLQRRF